MVTHGRDCSLPSGTLISLGSGSNISPQGGVRRETGGVDGARGDTVKRLSGRRPGGVVLGGGATSEEGTTFRFRNRLSDGEGRGGNLPFRKDPGGIAVGRGLDYQRH